jgi:Translationally controlled tumour protein
MKVFKDIISGDELCSDSYPHKLIMDDACLEVKGRYVKKGSDQIAIASDDIIEEDENAPTVVDIVDSFQLNEIQMTKKDFMAYIKGFLATVT